MRIIFALSISLALGCAGTIAPVADAPVLCKLQTRDRVLTVYVDGGPVRYAVHGSDGKLVVSGTDLEQLRVEAPALYRLYRSTVATGGSAPVLLAN
jgi:hypothetical protein